MRWVLAALLVVGCSNPDPGCLQLSAQAEATETPEELNRIFSEALERYDAGEEACLYVAERIADQQVHP